MKQISGYQKFKTKPQNNHRGIKQQIKIALEVSFSLKQPQMLHGEAGAKFRP